MRGNRLLMGLVGVFLLATGTVQAGPISNPPAVNPGGTTIAMGDFTSTASFFDLKLDIPSEFKLLKIYDDDSDDGLALYQRYTFTAHASTLETPGTTNSASFNDSGILGLRITDLSGGTQGFSKIKLALMALSTTAPDVYTISYNYDNDGSDTVSWTNTGSFQVTVTEAIPEPPFALLLLSGLGVLAVAGRRRAA